MSYGQCPKGNERFECGSFEGHSGRCFFFERPAPEPPPALPAPPTSMKETGADDDS